MDSVTGARLGRRAVLGGLAGAAVVGGAGAAVVAAGRDDEPSGPPVGPEPSHQRGILERPPTSVLLTAYDVTVADRGALADLLARLDVRVGAVHASTGPGAATVTLAVGASLFDDRFGLAAVRPRRLTAMPEFPNDVPDPRWCHGDLLVQICAERADQVRVVDEDLRHAGGGGLRARWSIPGFRAENGVTADGRPTTRNLFGFREGVGNPDPADGGLMDRLVWVRSGGGEPDWAVGGTYQVVRLIRFATALWNADPVARQEAVFGRRREDGAPLGRGRETEEFDYADDPDGRMIRVDSHIRRANPRTPETAGGRILRRGYSYRGKVLAGGQPDEGLLFICFQQDVERGFATIQRRLAGEALDRYVLPYGGGYFFVPPAGDGLRRVLAG